jgi:segregation and condensation protein B
VTGEPSTLTDDLASAGEVPADGTPAGVTEVENEQHSETAQDTETMRDTEPELTDPGRTDVGGGGLNPELPLGIPPIADGDAAATAAPAVEVVPEHDLVGALEAVLLVVDAPVTEVALSSAVGHRPARIREVLLALAEHYTAASSGIELREINGGWRYYTRDRFAPVVERFVLDGAQSRLSRAALETLAVIAYRQPVTRARVSGVRGVNVDGVVRTLTSRGLIEDAGTDPDTGAVLYRTTDLFIERLGLSDLSELPSLGPLLPDIDGIDDV